ncbi:MAG: ATP-binding protein [Bacteroidetes bacterium]|nr:ATP-binding protein [Bacteroidota bacterium]
MTLDRFRLATASRTLLMTVTISLFTYLLFHSSLYEMAALMGILALYQVFSFIRWIEKKNRNLARFLEAVEAADFTQTFSMTRQSKAFDELNRTLNRIAQRFEEMKVETEDQFQYFQFVVEQLTVGLIVFRQDGKIDMINRAAKRLLGVAQLKNVRELRPISNDLFEALASTNPRKRNLVRIESSNVSVRLAIQISGFRMREVSYTLASLQDMRGELEEIELDAWQNLIRVLTHEIVNSIAPIASLASTANKLLSDTHSQSRENGESVPPAFEDVQTAVRTIEARSEGLLRFVNSYRTLTHIPNPKFRIFPIWMLFSRVEQLVRSAVNENGISLTTNVNPQSLELTADPDLLEQVLLNLLMNSIQALDGKTGGQINLSAQLEEKGKISIRVEDNGSGIPKDVQEKIFIPFFTTRENGSGIGLSLSRQILHLHHALISVWSQPDEKTVLTIVF